MSVLEHIERQSMAKNKEKVCFNVFGESCAHRMVERCHHGAIMASLCYIYENTCDNGENTCDNVWEGGEVGGVSTIKTSKPLCFSKKNRVFGIRPLAPNVLFTVPSAPKIGSVGREKGAKQ